MAKARNRDEAAAREAARRLERAREMGQQLELLPAEPRALEEGERGGRGRGKAVSQLRRWLAAQGYAMPEDRLAQMAGLDARGDAVEAAMGKAERVIAWAGLEPTPRQRVELFLQLYAAQLRAADALMPYGAAKVSADGGPVQAVQVVVQGGTGPAEAAPRAVVSGRMRPPPLPWENEGKQGVEDARDGGDGGEGRTDAEK